MDMKSKNERRKRNIEILNLIFDLSAILIQDFQVKVVFQDIQVKVGSQDTDIQALVSLQCSLLIQCTFQWEFNQVFTVIELLLKTLISLIRYRIWDIHQRQLQKQAILSIRPIINTEQKTRNLIKRQMYSLKKILAKIFKDEIFLVRCKISSNL